MSDLLYPSETCPNHADGKHVWKESRCRCGQLRLPPEKNPPCQCCECRTVEPPPGLRYHHTGCHCQDCVEKVQFVYSCRFASSPPRDFASDMKREAIVSLVEKLENLLWDIKKTNYQARKEAAPLLDQLRKALGVKP
jgi:hypothetical protein